MGAHQVVLGLEVALYNMSLGQAAEVAVPPLFGYGAAGCLPAVPPNATCLIWVELVGVRRGPAV